MPTDVSIFFIGCAVALLLTLAVIRATLFFSHRSLSATRAQRITRAQEFADHLYEQGLSPLSAARALELSRKQMQRYIAGKDAIPKYVHMALEQLIQTRQSDVLKIRQRKPALTVIHGGKAPAPSSTTP
jgi:hypothetical protein